MFWIVDPEGPTVEVFALGPEGHSLALHASGTEPVSPLPFTDLALAPTSLWL